MQPLSHKRPTNLTRFLYGSPYYPEQWDAETRASDPERMAAAGWNCARMAEFAWDLMEPSEGQFNFTLFDEAIAALAEQGIETILCTPTATPPAWLTHAHPDMLRLDANLVRMQHGSRQHACYSSEVLREYSRRITRAMAEHYDGNPHVIGWQTDNEINCQMPECHCENCQQAFREFLREKYHGDLAALNRAWGTAFWSQTFGSFDQITTPRLAKPTHPNPSWMLDYARFLSWTVTRFQHDQVEILRGANGRWFITHNGMFRHVDYRGLFTRDLDFIGYDVYPQFNYTHSTRRFSQAFNLDVARAWSGNFMVPEQQSGPGGQGDYIHDTPEPGEMRRMAYTSIARGADSLLFFRWRTARFGAEEYWCGVLDHDSVPRRRYAEAKTLGEELKRVGPAVLGTHVFVNTAVSGADMEVTDGHAALSMGLPGPDQVAAGIHKFLNEQGHAVGVIHPSDDLSGVALYFIPHWSLFDPAWVPNLQRYVEDGGVLVIGSRTASKDMNNHVIAQTLPGCLAPLAGVTVEEYGKQNSPDERPLWIFLQSQQYQTRHWYEILKPAEGTEVVATWKGRHLNGLPAVTLRRAGKGLVLYVGCYLTEDLVKALYAEITRHRELPKLWPFAPAGVEVVKRQDEKKEVWFFINHAGEEVTIPTVPAGDDLTRGAPSASPLALPPNGVTVITCERKATPAI